MELYIWRHGKAESNIAGGKDEERVLTPEGRNDLIELLDSTFGTQENPKPDKIFSSPILRAKESAELMQGVLGCKNGLEIMPELSTEADLGVLIEAIRSVVSKYQSCILVGHNPNMEALADRLTDFKKTSSISIDTGGFVKIKIDGWNEPYQGKYLFSKNPPLID